MAQVINLSEYKAKKKEEKHQKDLEYLNDLLKQHYFYDVEDLPPMVYDVMDFDNIEITIGDDNGKDNV